MSTPEIKGFIDLSLVDWDGKVSSVIFLPDCNMRCPFCYNVSLVLSPEKLQTILFEEVEEYLEKNRGWIDGVVITGGEPTIHGGLINLCRKIKILGLMIKLDTNGTNSDIMRNLIDNKLVDYIAMDIKAPLTEEKYSAATGVDAKNLLEKIDETIDIVLKSEIDYEFRTTLVPTLHCEKDIETICRRIKDGKKYVIQSYKADVETINPNFKNLKPFTQEQKQTFLKVTKRIIPNTILRG